MVNKLNSSYNKYMQKVLIADLVKAAEPNMGEFNPDLGEAGTIDLGSLGEAYFRYDYDNGNYIVDISFKSTGDSVEYILDGDQISDLNDNGATYYNNELRRGKPDNPHWPFGSLDHLHWPNQRGK
jgi:hypothetical protein